MKYYEIKFDPEFSNEYIRGRIFGAAQIITHGYVKDFVHRWHVSASEVSLRFEATETQAQELDRYIKEYLGGYLGMECLG